MGEISKFDTIKCARAYLTFGRRNKEVSWEERDRKGAPRRRELALSLSPQLPSGFRTKLYHAVPLLRSLAPSTPHVGNTIDDAIMTLASQAPRPTLQLLPGLSRWMMVPLHPRSVAHA